MKKSVFVCLMILTMLIAADSEARREIKTPKQKERLAQVNRVYIHVIALTDRGQVDAGPIAGLVSRRLKEVGYTVVTDAETPHDVQFRVKCEQRKVWQGTIASGGDADLPDSPMRTWKGPACQLTYDLRLRNLGWRKEVRADFVDSIKAARAANVEDAGAYALEKLQDKLERYDFPVLLTADWGQEDRLLKLFDAPGTTSERKVKIIGSLGLLFSNKAVPRLQASLTQSDFGIAKAAVMALGDIGHRESIEALNKLLRTGRPELKVEAARSLGKVGALHGDFSVVPPLLEALQTDDFVLKTEVVWALGKLPDKRSHEPLLALQLSLRNIRTSDRHSKEGKLWDAVSYSLKQIDPSDQIN